MSYPAAITPCCKYDKFVFPGISLAVLQNVQRQLSCWLRGQVNVFQNSGAANASLVQFFKQQGDAARKVGQ